MALAAAICAIGVYASFAISHHAARAKGGNRTLWSLVSIISSGCTAWATHFIILLAFNPGMPSAFEPVLTAASLASAIVGIGAGVLMSINARQIWAHFLAGLVLGLGITTLHYVGQAAYLVEGYVSWNLRLVIPSIIISLPLSGLGMVAAASRSQALRRCAAPLLLASIAILHFCGMAAMSLHFDPSRSFPSTAVSPAAITPVVAGISLALIALALLGWRFDLAAIARLRQDRRRLRELADVALEGLLICQSDVIVAANSSIEQLAGYDPGMLAGVALNALFPTMDFSKLPEREEREIDLVMRTSRPVPVRVLRCELALGHKMQTVIAVRDQRERLRTEAKIRQLAFNDSLTGLSNRSSYVDRLRQLSCEQIPFALLSIDLDRFKAVNDQFGHLVGDQVLAQVGDRLRSLVGPKDLVARVGGDEFAIILIGDASATRSCEVGRQINRKLAEPFTAGSVIAYCGASVGIVLPSVEAATVGELRQRADLALYRAKIEGRGTICLFDPEMDTASRDRRALEGDLRKAIFDGQITLAYQPVVSAVTGAITSVEALARWTHPVKGPIPPDIFISLAEECGLIETLGTGLLRVACRDATRWPENLRVAVNLSPLQFQAGNLSETVERVLTETGLVPNRLQLEVTEGLVIRDVDRTFAELERLRALGIQILMDDFGVGYSSLSYFERFPFDKVKIDKSFVDKIVTSRASRAIVQAVVGLGGSLGMGVVAEGVETEEQMRALVGAGCTYLQGFLFSKPVNANDIDSIVSLGQKYCDSNVDRAA
ncbi:EAL domain-containing protein [Sphingomonas sp. AP4-R1]|uniref:bifunctional diguanylate cyclase/phosphodiesterase n=1 Tax=Sphingomonas sp. AP4-R1 TaxID=2735134 RepID=UPI001493AFB2|nr:EAL domain-containing protein [Sphingomonas sp. AP4-R1]QJU57400.1 EAL domain-containing protein [Sphingomonas sp. AP4-R1]